MYKIANNKNRKMINTYIEELEDKDLLRGYFGTFAKNIKNRTRVKNSEILELLIYGAYIEEQNKLEDTELNIFKKEANYYYNEGINEVRKAKGKQKKYSLIPDYIILYLLTVPNYSGLTWSEYIETMIRNNSNQLYRQCLINIQQQRPLEIDADEFQRIIKQQNNQRLSVKGDNVSGAVDLQMIGTNNLAKIEGMKQIAEDDAMVEFISDMCDSVTEVCENMNGKRFYINKGNSFDRYWRRNTKRIKTC